MFNNYDTIIIYAIEAEQAEQILRNADRFLRRHWNLYGFHRLGSGWDTIMTDGFGNPYSRERELKVFGIAIEVPSTVDFRCALTYVEDGGAIANCYAEYYFA